MPYRIEKSPPLFPLLPYGIEKSLPDLPPLLENEEDGEVLVDLPLLLDEDDVLVVSDGPRVVPILYRKQACVQKVRLACRRNG